MADEKPVIDEDMDEEIVAMKARVQAMEAEAAQLKAMQEQVEKDMNAGNLTDAAKEDIDNRSVYVGGVDYSSTPEELQAHFQSCGTINRITILCDKWTGHPKGFAYIEFADPANVDMAVSLNDSLFKGRLLKVSPKRTNVPAFMRGGFRGAPRGRVMRGGGRGFDRGGFGRGRPPYSLGAKVLLLREAGMSQLRVLNAPTLRLRNQQRPSYHQYLDNGDDSDEQMDDSGATDDPEYIQHDVDVYHDDEDDDDDDDDIDDEVDDDCDDDSYSEAEHSDRGAASGRGIALTQPPLRGQDFRDLVDTGAHQTQLPARDRDTQVLDLKDPKESQEQTQQNQMDLRKQIIQIQQDSSVSPQEKAKKIQVTTFTV
ncbi:cytoplasmic RNA-binding protein [Entophlyctis sp. JEL0112]|nr:cytoplasmic RNA-binding protein [Entophlyctis sp. JEL0112]